MDDTTREFFDVPLILPDSKLREIVLDVLNEWAHEHTADMEDFLKEMRVLKDMSGASKGRTPMGERVLGVLPGFVVMRLRMILGQDWWRQKDSALGIVFEVFREGRIFEKEGGSYRRVELNDADRAARTSTM